MTEQKKLQPNELPVGNRELPIWQKMPEIIETMKTNNRLALVSETGSGKSTQVPQALWEAGFADSGKIYIVENRVVVATEVARRVANEMRVPLGSTVGYITGHERNVSDDTKIVFVTNGVFKHIVQKNPTLTGVSIVIFDEFDERYLLSDIGLALTEKAQDRESHAKFILMSATLNAQKIQDHFQGIPLIEAKGRPFPVEEHFLEENIKIREMPSEAARVVDEIHRTRSRGDILIFMPGKGEIDDTIEEIMKLQIEGVTVLPLHAELSPEQRDKVFKPGVGRKIIISTNVAERGVTINGVKFVIDSGLVRMNTYNPVADITRLGIEKTARDSLIQRRGRAGRTEPGECFYLISQKEFASRPVSTPPEIQRSSLRSVVLQIKAMGYSREDEPIRLMDAPEKQNWKTAKNQLRLLGALDSTDETKLSEKGRIMAEMSCDPRDAAMILKGCELGCGEEMAIIAAVRNTIKRLIYMPYHPEEHAEAVDRHRAFRSSKASDLFVTLSAFRAAEQNKFDGAWCRVNYVSWIALRDIRKTKDQLIEQVKRFGFNPISRKVDEKVMCKAIAAGFPDRIYKKSGGDRYVSADGEDWAILGNESVVPLNDILIANERVNIQTRRGGTLPIIRNATIVPED